MILSLERMPADGLRFSHQYEANELDLDGREFELRKPPAATVRIDRVGLDIRVRGAIKTSLVAPCDRCLAEVELTVAPVFDLLYTPGDAESSRSNEIELNVRDLALATYENEELDLDALVLEQIELELPTRVLCKEDCRGLCSMCGVDLNVERCDCQKPIDPRWEALKALKAESENEE
jgi:uncharacterized protein